MTQKVRKMSNLRPMAKEEQKCVMIDEKKRKRMISNRESARRSRMKKQILEQEMAEEINRLKIANEDIEKNIKATSQVYMMYKGENDVLKAQELELVERFKSLNGILKNSGMMADEDFLELPDPSLRPWELPCALQQPIVFVASSGSSQF